MERTVVRLPVVWHRQGSEISAQVAKAMQVFACVLGSLDEVFDFALVVNAGFGRRTAAWFEVESFDIERTAGLAEQLSLLLEKHVPWLGLGAPEVFAPLQVAPYRFELTPGIGSAKIGRAHV